MKSSHFDKKGSAKMVDISKKKITTRIAIAEGFIHMQKSTLEMIQKGLHKKGDVLSIARIAGIMGSKKTSELIPLCHPLNIEAINIDFEINNKTNKINVLVNCKTTNKTGIEIEALTAVSICTLTIYDMCKSVDRSMFIRDIRLVHKSGGNSGTYNKK
ncbi:MAG: cyclic pyranopterin monophosphate synthase MoaC [Alphaproteobacteria bacterium TMED62]|nr:MAG: cyclic pyranopterin monophosphate synthase MoaC [Alphaproteobacteria bacterium TMED62]|tara:strand:+ start:12162 stop:12635 length:474 start_codon:yes stop_codon:yes gene_type:complete